MPIPRTDLPRMDAAGAHRIRHPNLPRTPKRAVASAAKIRPMITRHQLSRPMAAVAAVTERQTPILQLPQGRQPVDAGKGQMRYPQMISRSRMRKIPRVAREGGAGEATAQGVQTRHQRRQRPQREARKPRRGGEEGKVKRSL
jgi:hypothetical protein